ncbi:hypothetical protein [Janthinobacterium sp. HH102]|uniref:hypothetical protein n=2 Tax=unclassified Janthinobacterium TaxID=2610881 RepID=UPI000A9EE1E0|nr:hypothetical protein [Janthinobacterium sp. HH102]
MANATSMACACCWRRLAGATTFLQLIIGRYRASAADAPHAAAAVASTSSTACSSCWTVPGRRHPVLQLIITLPLPGAAGAPRAAATLASTTSTTCACYCRRLAGAIQFLQLIIGLLPADAPGARTQPPRGPVQVDGAHQLLHGAQGQLLMVTVRAATKLIYRDARERRDV